MDLKQLMDLVVTPYISEDLISKDQMEKIGKVARHFPSQLSSFFGFECKLGETEPKADFLFCITQANDERRILSNNHPKAPFPESFAEEEVWQRINRFAQAWNSPGSPLYYQANKIWFEFDMDEIDIEKPVPSFFFGPQNINSREDVKNVCSAAFEPLLGNKLDIAIQKSLWHCIDTLPEHARIFQVGTMLSRNTTAIRICINKTKPADILSILQNLDWSGELEELKSLLNSLVDVVDFISLAIDLGSKAGSKIGLECYINDDETASDKWIRFMALLVEWNLCQPAKEKGLLSFGGGVHRFMTDKIWPEHWLTASRQIKNRQLSAYLRNPHHIKITYRPQQPLEAKAYLGVKHLWVHTKVLIDAQRQAQAMPSAGGY